jgi:hypothetical protein
MAIVRPGVFPDTAFPDRCWAEGVWAEYGYTSPILQMGKRFVEMAGHASDIPDYVPSTIGSGRQIVTTAGTSVRLGTTLTIGGVIVVAEFGNTGVICVGGSNVIADESTRLGVPLNPGDAVILTIDDISKIWLDSTIDGDGVTYTQVQ